MKNLKLLLFIFSLFFAFACSESKEHTHENGTENHTHEDGTSHKHDNEELKQEEFTVTNDSTKMDSVAVDSLKKDTHVHKDGTHHHDHDHN